MRNLENYGVNELPQNEILTFNGGIAIPRSAKGENYNHVLAVLFGPFYDAGYVLGKYF